MSEKRFTLDDESRIWDNGMPMPTSGIVVMLNEQQATINRLETELKCYKGIIEALERTRVIEVEIPTDKMMDSKMVIDDERSRIEN